MAMASEQPKLGSQEIAGKGSAEVPPEIMEGDPVKV